MLFRSFDGTGFLIFKTHAKVITAYIRGAQRLPFSKNPNRKKLFPRVSVHFSGIQPPPDLGVVSATQARGHLIHWLRDRMVEQQFETEMAFAPATVPEAIAQAARLEPGRRILQDATLQELTYRRLLLGADVLTAQWRQLLDRTAPRVGVLLPNVNATPVVVLSLWGVNKTPAILNYTTGPAILLACARLAGLKQVITARSFVTRAKLDRKSVV